MKEFTMADYKFIAQNKIEMSIMNGTKEEQRQRIDLVEFSVWERRKTKHQLLGRGEGGSCPEAPRILLGLCRTSPSSTPWV